jgi:hypothetical protein
MLLKDGDADGIADAEDVKVLETALHDIDQAIVAIGVGGHHEEARTENVISRVADEALDLFFILKANANPEAGLNRRVLVEVKGFVMRIAIEGIDEEDGFCVGDRDVPNLSGIDHGEANAVE